MTNRKQPTTNRVPKRSNPSASDFRLPNSALAKTPRLYHLVIPCRDEHHQRSLYNQLTRAGHPCRVITL